MSWVKYKDKHGVRLMGKNKYDPPQPWESWTKIMGVVARCEGNHDTVISYDGTGVTWGFMQWTFTSGRLQKLLEYLKSVQEGDLEVNPWGLNLYDKYFAGKIEPFGFYIKNGKFMRTSSGLSLDPRTRYNKRKIDDICMGRVQYDMVSKQKWHATELAKIFADAGKLSEISYAQIDYARDEFKRSIQYTRKPLGKYKTLANLLEGTWEGPVPAIFFNLWQNSPAAAYKLFIRAKDASETPEDLQEIAWGKLKKSKFANWSYAKPGNKSPRIRRIAKAVKEFYGISLPVR